MHFPPGWIRRLGLMMILFLGCVPASQALLSIYVEPEALAQRADLVLEGQVRAIEYGVDPVDRSVNTYITLDVIRTHHGAGVPSTLIIRELGGRVDGRVHVIDASPQYQVGEQVFAFLNAAPDGALRTTQAFFGKFSADPARPGRWQRDLQGAGLLGGVPRPQVEELSSGDLIATTLQLAEPKESPRWKAVPPRFELLEFAPVHPIAAKAAGESGSGLKVPLSESHPSRWMEPDSGQVIELWVDPDNSPLESVESTLTAVRAAARSWTEAPESRLRLQLQSAQQGYQELYANSPTQAYLGQNVMLFGDPFDEIDSPVDCGGILALGGYWRSETTAAEVNGTEFYSVMQLYVVFNDEFDCFLGDALNLEEVAGHELGHGLGLGHSETDDALMRGVAYGDRGGRLGLDDRDAAHCVYPHQFELLEPQPDTRWVSGVPQRIKWSSSAHTQVDPGAVNVELSWNGGQTWEILADGIINDGELIWTPPLGLTGTPTLRILQPHLEDSSYLDYPTACSGARLDGSITLAEPRRIDRSFRARRIGGGVQ